MKNNNLNKIIKIIKNAKTFSLTSEERDTLLKNISTFADANPISRETGAVLTPYKEFVWFPSFFGLTSNKFMKFMPVTLLILVILGGGTSFAANGTLPGDFLYPAKIHINEKIESLMTFGTGANAKLESKFATARLEEIEKLALRSDISVETKNEVKANFNKHASKVKELVTDLEATGEAEAAASVNSEFESSLREHRSVLAELARTDKEDQATINEIDGDVSAHLNSATEATETKSDGENNNNQDKQEEEDSSPEKEEIQTKIDIKTDIKNKYEN